MGRQPYRPIIGTDFMATVTERGWDITETQSRFLIAKGAPWSWPAYGRLILKTLVDRRRGRRQPPRPLRRRSWGK